MPPAPRILVVLPLAAALLTLPAPVAADGDHGEGADGPGAHSKNLKLFANVPRSASATQSDLAFQGDLVYAGNYLGFRVIDVKNPQRPNVLADVRCNGAQGDVSVWGPLLFQSVDAPQSHGGCDSTSVAGSTPGMFEGIRIFDVSNPRAPQHLASIPTPCGSHTHTLYPDPANGRVVVYVSSYPLGAAAQAPDCQRREDGGGHSRISIVNVPLADPAAATVSPYFLDAATEWATYLGQFTLRACHDLTVSVPLKLVAAACMSEAQLWDISDPLQPTFLWRYDNPAVRPENVDLFHSAAFSWEGAIIAFGDESGGGGAARCVDPTDAQGRIWFVDRVTGAELGSYKIPRSETGTCTMHNFNFIPLRNGQRVLVSSAYTGGTTVVDVTDPAAPVELAFYRPSDGNAWSSYWYNGYVYTNDILRGVDVLQLTDDARGTALRLPLLNPQTQDRLIG